MTLQSAADAFVDSSGELLDGDADSSPGGDYVTQFQVTNGQKVVDIPDFARGPGQMVDVLADLSGLPIRIDDATGVQDVSFELAYDPNLLDVEAIDLPADLANAGWTLSHTLDLQNPTGSVQVDIGGPGGRTGETILAQVSAQVPAEVEYGSAQAVEIRNVQLNAGAIAGVGASAVQVAAFLGDASGNLAYRGLDPSLMLILDTGRTTGFDAFPRIDPIIVADITGNGTVSPFDAVAMQQETLFVNEGSPDMDRADIPPIPDPPASVLAAAAFAEVSEGDDASLSNRGFHSRKLARSLYSSL